MIQITNEKGETLKKIPVQVSDIITGGLYRIENFEGKYPCLSKVDLYGQTVFNALQVGSLVTELKKLKSDLIDTNVPKTPFSTNYPGIISEETILEALNELIDFVRLDTHEYLKFIGD